MAITSNLKTGCMLETSQVFSGHLFIWIRTVVRGVYVVCAHLIWGAGEGDFMWGWGGLTWGLVR